MVNQEIDNASKPELNPSAEVRDKPQGSGANERKKEQFRAKKNKDFKSELTATLLKRLKVTDPTAISAINLQSSIVPARIPISLRGLPSYTKALWARMISIGTRPFGALATPENYAIFLKCVMVISEAKLCYAQMKCQQVPPFELPSIGQFNEMELRILASLSRRLPYPIVMFLEAIGNFTTTQQPVVPTFIKVGVQNADADVSYAPSDLHNLLQQFKELVAINGPIVVRARLIDELPNINWVEGVIVAQPVEPAPAQPLEPIPAIRASPETLAFWNGQIPSAAERQIFNQIISALESKRGFIIHCDITIGEGSVLQAVRFPNTIDAAEIKTQYYANTDVPQIEEQLAPAFLLGFEHQGTAFSRFCSSYAECLKHGSASREEALHAVIWNDSQ